MTQFEERRKEMVRNLGRLYRQATPADIVAGERWYPEAHRIVIQWAESYELSIACVACVIAAISPQCNWTANLVIASEVLQGRGTVTGGALPANVRKARRILEDRGTNIVSYFPHGPKVASFAVNLAGDFRYPTVDTHGMQAAVNDVKADYRLKWAAYQVFADCYIAAAGKARREPAEFQAIIWHIWKRLHPAEQKRIARQQWSVIGDLGNERENAHV